MTRNDLRDCYTLAGRYPVLTPEQEAELGQRAADGDEEARWGLVLGNLRIAARLALRRAGNSGHAEDYFADAVMGMYRAACRFDPARNRRFMTLAHWHIRGAFSQSTPDYLLIRVPHNLLDNFAKLSGRHGAAARRALATTCISDTPLRDEPEAFGAAPEDVTREHAERERRIARVRQWVQQLPPRLRGVIESRFGLDERPRESLEEIGRRMGLSKERVRQLEHEARVQLRKLARRDGTNEPQGECA